MGFWVIVIAAIFGFSAQAEKLTYFAPEPQFEVENTGKSVFLKTPVHSFKVNIKPCNQSEVDHFWKNALGEFERHPKVSGTPSAEFAELGNERRMILPGPASSLRSLDKAFLTLMAMDKRLCR